MIQPAGRPMDLATVLDRPGTRPAKVQAPEAARTGFSFGDFIDVINPLQHIPGVAELYRSVTNDQISDEARKTGNALYGFALGGPIGLGAMMAYNAVGDRLNAAGDRQPAASPQVAEAASAGAAVDSPPVPQKKPETAPEPASQPVRETALLGTDIAATGQTRGATAPLTGLVNGAPAAAAPVSAGGGAPSETSVTASSSVAYVDVPDEAGDEAPVVPNDAGLSRLATHQSNRLPLDVLKALQERHAERTASERS